MYERPRSASRGGSNRRLSSRAGGGQGGRNADDESEPEIAALITRTTLLQRVRTPAIGLHSRIVYAGDRRYLLIGAPLARLAREAERIKLP